MIKKNLILPLIILQSSCSGPDYYGDPLGAQIYSYYRGGGSFDHKPEWSGYELDHKYHVYLHMPGGAHSDDYVFNLLQFPKVETNVKILRAEIISEKEIDTIFSGTKKISSSTFLGRRSGRTLRKLCDKNKILTVRVTTTEKVITFKMKLQKTSILDIS